MPTASPGPNGSVFSWNTTACTIAKPSVTSAPAKKATTTGCQPRNAPTIIIRSASPSPSASRPRPRLNTQRTPRSIQVPTSIPTSPVASPDRWLPSGIQSGSGPQTGHGYRPCPISFGSASHHCCPGGGTMPGMARLFGHGQGQRTAPINPRTVPNIVSGRGISRHSRSQTAATMSRLSRIAWCRKKTHACHGIMPLPIAHRCCRKYGRSWTLAMISR